MTVVQKLDVQMAELCVEQAELEEDAEEVAIAKCQKAFEYQKRATLCINNATAWLEKEKGVLPRHTSALVVQELRVRLEKLTLPSFDGGILSFISFWEVFDNRVHSNPTLHPIDKFGYLMSRCKGRASEPIAAIPRTSAGYELAIETLKRRFGQKAPIIDSCLTELIELKRLPDDCSTWELRRMLDLINIRVRTLLSLVLDAKGERSG